MAAEQFLRVADLLPEPILLVSVDGTILAVNRAAEECLGLERGQVAGQRLTDIATDSPETLSDYLRLCSRNRKPLPGSLTVLSKDGKVACRCDGAVFEPSSKGRPASILLRLRAKETASSQFQLLGAKIEALNKEIAKRKQIENELREFDRRKDGFLATLAHELRNPLAPMSTALELIRRADSDALLREEARGLMERQLRRMVRLVDDLLDISRINKGKMQLRKERVALSAVVESALEAARPSIDNRAHELTVILPPGPVYLDADATRLAQVFGNLLDNAAKYTEIGGRIWLTAECQGREVIISVRDTGIGIAPEYLTSVFDMFSQVQSALERSQGGLGIGLSLVRQLVELHGGTIEASSGGIGMGSEFTVRFPVAETPLVATEEPSHNCEQSRWPLRARVLVVDDNRDAADSLAMMLQLMGHDIEKAYDGVVAVQSAAVFRPSVALLDIGLPKLNGYEVARQIREQPWGDEVVLIALTGWGQDEDKRRAFQAGFDHHMTKPVDPTALEGLLAMLKPETT